MIILTNGAKDLKLSVAYVTHLKFSSMHLNHCECMLNKYLWRHISILSYINTINVYNKCNLKEFLLHGELNYCQRWPHRYIYIYHYLCWPDICNATSGYVTNIALQGDTGCDQKHTIFDYPAWLSMKLQVLSHQNILFLLFCDICWRRQISGLTMAK